MSFTINTQAQALISGTIDAAGESLDLTSPNSSTSIIQITGTWSGSLVVEGSNDETNWNSIYSVNSNTQLFQDSITSNGYHTAPTNGFQSLRLRADSWTSGTVQINVYGSDAASFIKTDSQIRGSSDGTLIGNTGDLLRNENYGIDPQGANKVTSVGGRVDSNSTSTPLGPGATFTGAFVDCSQYASIVFAVITDQPSAENGAKIEFSTDGTAGGILRTIEYSISPLPDGGFLAVPCEASFFRIVYTNGATAQTVFNLSTQLKITTTGQTVGPLITPIGDLTTAPLTRTVITGKSTGDDYVNQRAAGISTVNSTNTPLGAGAEFTGDWEECLGYSNMNLTLSSDVQSAEDGIIVEWSTDGVNVDNDDTYTTKDPASETLSFGIISRYFRIRYINGSTAQTSFRLQSLLHIARPKPSVHRIEDSISGQNDAELSKAVITGQDPNGDFINKPAGGVSQSNTTTTPLLANAEFLGDFVQLKDYGGLSVAIDTDVDGTLEIEASSDGVTLSGIIDTFNVVGGESFFIGLAPRRAFARIRYTNGATDQTTFDLQTIVSEDQLSASSQPINTRLSNNSVATNSRSVITGQDGTGTFRNAKVDENGNLQTVFAPESSIIPTLGNNLYYDDMDTNSGGIARDTVITNTWTKIYDSTLAPTAGNSGLMLGILITLENFDTTADKSWVVRLVVDGQEVYGVNGIKASDLIFVDKYGMNNTNNTIIPSWGGFNPRQDTFRWDAPVSLPISYSSGVQVYIKKISEDRRFRAGLACLTKD